MSRLNLGCGPDIRPGYTNVDFRYLPGVDLVVDLSKFPWPFDDQSADEIMMLDFLEHFPYRMTAKIILECVRVLRPGGSLIIQVPDAEQLSHAIAQVGPYFCNRCGFDMLIPDRGINWRHCRQCGQSQDAITEAAMARMYGGQDFDGNFHHTCFTKRSLRLKVEIFGFELKELLEPEHQAKNWNFKARFQKREGQL